MLYNPIKEKGGKSVKYHLDELMDVMAHNLVGRDTKEHLEVLSSDGIMGPHQS